MELTVTSTAFSSLALPAGLVDNLSTLGYAHMTPVQAQSSVLARSVFAGCPLWSRGCSAQKERVRESKRNTTENVTYNRWIRQAHRQRLGQYA